MQILSSSIESNSWSDSFFYAPSNTKVQVRLIGFFEFPYAEGGFRSIAVWSGDKRIYFDSRAYVPSGFSTCIPVDIIVDIDANNPLKIGVLQYNTSGNDMIVTFNYNMTVIS